jgi:hypothetical protein
MFIGQASAIGLAIDIPSVIRSLAEYPLLSDNNSLLSNLGQVLTIAIGNDNVNTHSVKTYIFNWWDKDKVSPFLTFFTFKLI